MVGSSRAGSQRPLACRELEPWFAYERTEKEFEINPHAVSFEDMAEITQTVFFDQRRKPQQSDIAASEVRTGGFLPVRFETISSGNGHPIDAFNHAFA